MIKAIFLFILAGLAEIGGGYLIWQWLREGASSWLGLLGGIALVLYGFGAVRRYCYVAVVPGLWACICSLRRYFYCFKPVLGMVG